MSWMRFWQRRRRDRELARELEAYLEQETAEQMAAGKSAGEARLAAHRKLGVQQLDPTLPIHDVRTIEQQISRSLILDRMIARLSSVLAGLAVLLAMVGLYGVMTYTVSRRTREIAVRMALGAARSKVAALVVKDMLTLVVSGVLLAVPAVWALGRVLGPVLHEVTATDPATLVAAVGVLLGGAFAAIWIPSRRALQIDPTAALHDE